MGIDRWNNQGPNRGSLHSTIIRVQPAQPIRLTTNFQNMSEFAHWNLDQPHGLLEKTIIAKRLDRLEIPLDQTQQSNHELRHTRGTHSLRNWKFWVDHQIHLSGLTALTNQRQSRIRGQISFSDFRTSKCAMFVWVKNEYNGLFIQIQIVYDFQGNEHGLR